MIIIVSDLGIPCLRLRGVPSTKSVLLSDLNFLAEQNLHAKLVVGLLVPFWVVELRQPFLCYR